MAVTKWSDIKHKFSPEDMERIEREAKAEVARMNQFNPSAEAVKPSDSNENHEHEAA